MYQRTGGNPFFVEEIVQSLVESGRLEGERGAYRLSGKVVDLEIPPTVHAVLAARIDRLAERDKRLLQVASVIGREVPEPVLAEVAGIPANELADALATLQRGEFLLQHILYPEAEYLFKHALTRDVAYSSQLAEPRARLHASVACATEARAGERVEEQAGLLAQHWEAAGEPFTAAQWYVRSSAWAGLTQGHETLRHLQRAIDLLQGIEPTDESRALEAGAIGQILWLGPRVTTLEGGDQIAQRANELLQASADPLLCARLEYGVANYAVFGEGDYATAAEHFGKAISLADESGDLELRISTRYTGGMLGVLRGTLSASIEHLESGLELVLAHPEVGSSFLGYEYRPAFHAVLSVLTGMAGRCAESLAHGEQSIALAQESDLASRVLAYSFAGMGALYCGERELALSRGQRAVELAEPISARNLRGIALNALGRAHQLNENWAAACDLQQRVLSEGLNSQRMLAFRARALFEADSADAAISIGEELITYNQGLDAPGCQAEARLDLAQVLVRLDEPPRDRIDRELERAAVLIERTGAQTQRPIIHEIRALLNPESREEELREALRLYVEMGSAHAERIERELAR